MLYLSNHSVLDFCLLVVLFLFSFVGSVWGWFLCFWGSGESVIVDDEVVVVVCGEGFFL